MTSALDPTVRAIRDAQQERAELDLCHVLRLLALGKTADADHRSA